MRRESLSTLQWQLRRLSRVICRNTQTIKSAFSRLNEIEAESLRVAEHLLIVRQGLKEMHSLSRQPIDLLRSQRRAEIGELMPFRFSGMANAFYAVTRFRTENYLSLIERDLSILNAKRDLLRRSFAREQIALRSATSAARDCRARVRAIKNAIMEFECAELAIQRKWSHRVGV